MLDQTGLADELRSKRAQQDGFFLRDDLVSFPHARLHSRYQFHELPAFAQLVGSSEVHSAPVVETD